MNKIFKSINSFIIKLMYIIAIKKEEQRGFKEIRSIYKTARKEIKKVKKLKLENKDDVIRNIEAKTIDGFKLIVQLTEYHIQLILNTIKEGD